jgi:hypothetical protein
MRITWRTANTDILKVYIYTVYTGKVHAGKYSCNQEKLLMLRVEGFSVLETVSTVQSVGSGEKYVQEVWCTGSVIRMLRGLVDIVYRYLILSITLPG